MNRRNAMKAIGAAASSLAPRAAMAFEAGISDAVIRVGQSAVFSGPSARLGQEMRDGIEACFRRVNRAGGIFDRSLELVPLDDGYEPDRASANTQRLIEREHVFALLGYVGTPTSNAALPIFTGAGVPFVGAFTGAASLRSPFNKWIFNCRASYLDEGPAIVKQLTIDPQAKVAVFIQADSYGAAVRASIERALADRGMAPVAIATVERNSVDVTKAVDAIARSGATAVAAGSVAAACAALLSGLHAKGAYPMFASVSFIGTSALLERIGDAAKGIGISQVMPYPLSGALPLTRDYQQAMAAAGLSKLSYGSLEGYVAALTFILGLRRAGERPTRERFVRGLETAGQIDLGGFTLGFSPTNHNGSRFTDMTVIGDHMTLLH